MKKIIVIGLSLLLAVAMLTACAANPSTETQPAAQDEPAPVSEGSKEITLIARVFNNPWYQQCFAGAEAAGKELGYDVKTTGPDAGSNISQQVDQFNAAIDRKPAAVLIAALEPASLKDALQKSVELGVPIFGFDAGVIGDTSGIVLATVATDNVQAGALAADMLFADPGFQAAILKGTVENPTIIGNLFEDATSGSLVDRGTGFIDQMVKNLQTLEGLKDSVAVTGQTRWNLESAQPPKVLLVVSVPPTTIQSDLDISASSMLTTPNLVAIYASDNATVDALLSATADGSELDRTTGKYKDIYAVGFDAGKALKAAVRAKQFFGAITQDPYQIGYQSVVMVNDYLNGKKVSDLHPPALWWNSENMDQPEIARLLYD